MRIEAYQKLTLLDFPGKTACTVFTHGCNFRYPFCHNASLVIHPSETLIDPEEFFDYLNKRQGILDGVCITGGEPLIQKDIADFIIRIRDIGYSVKLDTNGSFPEKLEELSPLVDYIAMDIKNSKDGYAETIGTDDIEMSRIEQSVDYLMSSGKDFEFRTTVVKEFHNAERFVEIGKWISGSEKYFLQQFKDSGNLITEGLHPYDDTEMREFRDILLPYVPNVELRGLQT